MNLAQNWPPPTDAPSCLSPCSQCNGGLSSIVRAWRDGESVVRNDSWKMSAGRGKLIAASD